jgi:hypothetical protein
MGAKVQTPITQMNSGKLAPVMEGRTDVQVYPYSCRNVKNAIPLVYGSNKNRGGSAFVHDTADGEKVVLIPFKVGENVAYILEFGDHVIRFIKDHEMILDNDLPYEVETPYDLTDLIDANGVMQLDFQQSGDVIYLVHDKYQPQKLSRYGDTNWTLSALDLKGGPWRNMNTNTNKVIQASGTTGEITLTSVGNIAGSVSSRVYNPASDRITVSRIYLTLPVDPESFNTDQVFITSQESFMYPFYNEHTFRRYADIVNSAFPNLNLQVIFKRTGSGNNDYTVQFVFAGKDTSAIGISLTLNKYSTYDHSDQGTETLTIAATGTFEPLFTQAMEGQYLRLNYAPNVPIWYAGMTVTSGMTVKSDGNYYQAGSAGTAGNIKPTHTEGTESDGAINWTYLHSGYGIVQITEVIDEANATATVINTLPSEITSEGTDKWELSLLGQDGIWPSSVCFFKDRLAIGLNAKSGPQICFSCTGDYENFSDMTNGEVLATNAITLPILLDLNKIQWLCAQDNLFVGTEGGIVAVKAMTSSEVFGPDNVTYDNISSVGTCKIKPIRIGDDILYLGRLAKDIYAIQYNWETDSYAPDEVSLLAYDLLEEGISGWALQYEPNRIIWLVRRDGKIVGLTYNKKQSVRAFHLHETDGNFESVASIPAPDGTMDDVYFVAKRAINNEVVRYVEYFKNGLPLNIPNGLTQAQKLEYLLKNGWFLDCAKKYTFETASDQITGLEHLEGKTVRVFADGKVQDSKEVESGAITLDTPANNVLVGLPYETVIEPMPVNIDVGGTGQARSQRINQIVCRLYRSANFKYSWNNVNWRKAEVKDDNDMTLKSGDLLLNWGDSNTLTNLNSEDIVNATGARMLFKQDLPLPVCFVAFYLQIEVSNG